MRTVTIEVAGRELVESRFVAAMRGEAQGEFISFESGHALLDTLNANRWEILQVLAGRGWIDVAGLRSVVGRCLRDVQADVDILRARGVVEADASQRVMFPYDRVCVRFEWERTV
jgi:predicted transcriptional regulator